MAQTVRITPQRSFIPALLNVLGLSGRREGVVLGIYLSFGGNRVIDKQDQVGDVYLVAQRCFEALNFTFEMLDAVCLVVGAPHGVL